ncbi:SPFH domain-containing protein [Dokdonella sp.]|uniref:SPFH domain-containing protein n=1 Tax=Dokdonella sp. TaxID=2291710 RepID=UPI002F420382
MSDRLRAVKETSRTFLNLRTIVLAVAVAIGYGVYRHPPLESVGRQEVGVRLNRLTGTGTRVGEGVALVLPGIHELRRYSLLDQTYAPTRSAKADGEAPFQSSEGLSLGVELSIRYALDPTALVDKSVRLPNDIGAELVEPLVQGVVYKVFTRYTVREIFSSKRQELQDVIEGELKPLLAAEGIALKRVTMGNVDLPADYRAGMDKLLAVELETEQMQYTLQLKEKQVKQSELEAEAEKVKREKAAEASANEQVIAAKAQEEAMKHVIPFKQKQIEQRKLEADADKAARIRTAEGMAEARRIEAAGEADSRRKLAEADAYRVEQLGKVASEQLERDGALITKHPLLIQKTLADKLSDKVSVIIAPPPADGGFIGANLIGGMRTPAVAGGE